MTLAIHTGQRYGDLIRLRWSDFDGRALSLQQSKGKRRVFIPCTPAILAMLESTPRAGPYIPARAVGRPWFTAGNDKELGKAWRRHMEAAGIYSRPLAELSKEENKRHCTSMIFAELLSRCCLRQARRYRKSARSPGTHCNPRHGFWSGIRP